MATTIEDIRMDMDAEDKRQKEHDEDLIKRLLGGGYFKIANPDNYESIGKRIKVREAELKNEATERDIILKERAFNILWKFLVVETGVIFFLVILQGFSSQYFHIEEWSFKLLIVATISQITYMLQVAIKHLFPVKKQHESRS